MQFGTDQHIDKKEHTFGIKLNGLRLSAWWTPPFAFTLTFEHCLIF